MQKRRLIYTAIKRPLIKKIFLTLLVAQKTLYTFWSTDVKHISQCVQPWSQGLFSSHAMEKALGTRLIMCCLEELPVRPFPFFVCCRMRSLILGLSVGKEK